MMKRSYAAALTLTCLFVSPAWGEEALKVSYLGPAGTYTEEAALFYFDNDEELLPQSTVAEAIADVEEGRADYAVIPQENTLGGPVNDYVDALIGAKDVYVVGEVVLPISQTLMGVPGAEISDIQTVCSHAQGIAQSAEWRKENLPQAAEEEMASTAAAAEYVAEQQDKTIAAIAAPGAAALYGLEVLAENVQITDANKTRFYVLAARSEEAAGSEEATRAAFVADCGADQIDDIIVAFHEAGLEFTTLHDRPEGSRLGAYNYIFEVVDEDGITPDQIETVTGEVTEQILAEENFRLLGCFPIIEKVA